MSRSVVYAGTDRCGRCLLPPRWCVCRGLTEVSCPMAVDVLMHQREQWRPTSTGKLVGRVVAGSKTHVFLKDRSLDPAELLRSDRKLWVLHPKGELLEAGSELSHEVAKGQVLLLDGSWGEAGVMYRAVEGWGRPVSIRLEGRSRYWLREQQGEGQHSTVEALLGLFGVLGMGGAEVQLRLNFELHVYASLRARGHKVLAAEFLESSPIATAMPGILEALHERRPNESSIPGFRAASWNGGSDTRPAGDV